MTRKPLLIIAIIWAVILGGGVAIAFAVPTFTSVRLEGDRFSQADTWEWNGKPIIIERARKAKYTVACEVTPDKGEPRTLTVQGTNKRYPDEFTSWFSGSASMKCHGDARIHTGIGKTLYQYSKNPVFMFIAFAIAFGPLIAVFVFGRKQ